MRQKRAKAYKKYMAMYRTAFQFREPFQLLGLLCCFFNLFAGLIYLYSTVDSEICITANGLDMDLQRHFQIVLQGDVKISAYVAHDLQKGWLNISTSVITQCCIEELYRMGPEHQSSVNMAKTFERRKCNHREPIEGLECLKSVVGQSPLTLLVSARSQCGRRN
jgi:U3 small nucleolar RNA-associated protein 23